MQEIMVHLTCYFQLNYVEKYNFSQNNFKINKTGLTFGLNCSILRIQLVMIQIIYYHVMIYCFFFKNLNFFQTIQFPTKKTNNLQKF